MVFSTSISNFPDGQQQGSLEQDTFNLFEKSFQIKSIWLWC